MLTPAASSGGRGCHPRSTGTREEEREEAGDGIAWNKDASKWRAAYDSPGKRVHIGYYHIEEATAHAYQAYVEHGTLLARAAPTSAFRLRGGRKEK
mmetsp:Transcript_37822/g.60646  ORF Transcript_37822/g.60646 Transcript_37822/m.60646 type:complete len:96 (+) Transcript_37822:459-746(+)